MTGGQHTAVGTVPLERIYEVSEAGDCARLRIGLLSAVVDGKPLKNPLPCLLFNDLAVQFVNEAVAGSKVSVHGRILKTSYLVGKCDTRNTEYYLWVYQYEMLAGTYWKG